MSEDRRKYFEDAYSKYSKVLYRIAVLTTQNKSEAEDCVSDVFLKLISTCKRFESDEHEKAWLIRVCINVCKNKNKQYWNRNTTAIDACVLSSSADFIARLEMLDAIRKLSPKENLAIYLQYYENYSSQEISKFLKLSYGNTRTLLSRARRNLNLQISQE